MSQIDDYLKQVIVRNGSDLHFIAGEPPRARVYGELQILAPETLTASKVEAALVEIMSTKAREDFQRRDSTDFAYSLQDLARFRVNIFRHVAGMGGVFRAIPVQGQDTGRPQDAAGGGPALQAAPGDDPGHGQDRLRQVNDAGGHDRRDQPQDQRPYPHNRGPHRVRPLPQEVPDQPARDRGPLPQLCSGTALRTRGKTRT